MVKIIISLKARKDLDEIKNFIAKDNPEIAESFGGELLQRSIDTLSMFPLAYPLYNKSKNLRRVIYQSYNIYYKYDETNETAYILHIVNSAQLLNVSLKKLSL